MDEINKLALEAARAHAFDVDDLIQKASKIEAYLRQQNPPETKIETNQSNEFLDDVVKLSKNLTSDLAEMGFWEPDVLARQNYDMEIRNTEKHKKDLKKFARLIENCDLSSSPFPETIDLRKKNSMENYEFKNQDGTTAKLHPIFLQLGNLFETSNVVLNKCRQVGSTMSIAAFARQQATAGHFYKILVLTSNHSSVVDLNKRIDDVSVNVYSFLDVAHFSHAGEQYDYIIIDNAAHIPYALEENIQQYIAKCSHSETKLIMVSEPGQERGWFYQMFVSPPSGTTSIALDWRWFLTPNAAQQKKQSLGEERFGNQYENKFRPISE